ncbi:Glycine cleavage system, aminomethyltransferase protein T [Candidatus Magnetomoraceae bacterium gMMP-1]
MKKKSKKTLLYDWHVSYKANIACFGGYDMPLWYKSGAKNEHLAVLTNAGVFDTSHMAVVMLTGRDAFELLQFCFSRDLNACVGLKKSPLTPGRCVYGVYLNDQAGVIDDAIIYCMDSENYMIVVNAGMGTAIAGHLMNYKNEKEVKIFDLTDKLGKMDIQGPLSAKVIKKILAEPNKVFEKMNYFSFKGYFDPESPFSNPVYLTDGTPVLLSRTGYTGEFGFELFTAPHSFVKIWKMILESGKEFNLIPCGLAARDSLRTGAVLPLSHQDIGNWPFINNPWDFALPYNDDKSEFTKEFIGDNALKNIKNIKYTYPFVGIDLRKISTEDNALVLNINGNEIGTVLTCVSDMGIGWHNDRIYSIASPDKPENFKAKGLCCGFVRVNEKLDCNHEIEIKDNRRKLRVRIVKNIRPDRTARRLIED